MSDELKPCPFCGNKPILVATSDGGGELHCIHCSFIWIKPWGEWNTRVDSSLNDRIKVKTYLKIIGDLDAKLKTLQDDQRKGGEDYCNLMERFDDLHNENADLTAKLKLAVEAVEFAVNELNKKVYADTAQGWGIGGQKITSESDEAYETRMRQLQLMLNGILTKIGEQR